MSKPMTIDEFKNFVQSAISQFREWHDQNLSMVHRRLESTKPDFIMRGMQALYNQKGWLEVYKQVQEMLDKEDCTLKSIRKKAMQHISDPMDSSPLSSMADLMDVFLYNLYLKGKLLAWTEIHHRIC
jgi:hypothetical protein